MKTLALARLSGKKCMERCADARVCLFFSVKSTPLIPTWRLLKTGRKEIKKDPRELF